jgi:hypothetical protein
LVNATNTESFGSGKAGPSFVNNKGFFMFSTADASSTIDFSKAAIDEGAVDCLPSKEIWQTPLYSPSPLKNSSKDGNCRSLSLMRYGGLAHLRQLYGSGPCKGALAWI